MSPTLTHFFLSFLEYKNILQICYSQNIDGLEKKAGVTKIVQAHGNTEKAHCSLCYTEYKRSDLVIAMKKSQPMFCECKGPVKPDVVFFGESLPIEFEQNLHLIKTADLLLVIGTSLNVQPFSSLIGLVGNVPRIIINNTYLSTFNKLGLQFDNLDDSSKIIQNTFRDLLFAGDCDQIIEEILENTGWKSEFFEIFSKKLKKIG